MRVYSPPFFEADADRPGSAEAEATPVGGPDRCADEDRVATAPARRQT